MVPGLWSVSMQETVARSLVFGKNKKVLFSPIDPLPNAQHTCSRVSCLSVWVSKRAQKDNTCVWRTSEKCLSTISALFGESISFVLVLTPKMADMRRACIDSVQYATGLLLHSNTINSGIIMTNPSLGSKTFQLCSHEPCSCENLATLQTALYASRTTCH